MNIDPQFQRSLARVNQASDPIEEVRDLIEIYGESLDDDDLLELFEAPYEDILFVYSDEKRKNFFEFAKTQIEIDTPMSFFNTYVALMKIVRLMAESDLELVDQDMTEDVDVDFSQFSNGMNKKDREKFYNALHRSFYKSFNRFVDDKTRAALIDYSFLFDDEPIGAGARTYSTLVTNLRPLLLGSRLRNRVKDRLAGYRDEFTF